MMFDGAFLAFQNSYLLAEEGTMDPELREGLFGAILTVKDAPGMERYWRQRRITLHPRFVRYVDELLGRDGESPMGIYQSAGGDGLREQVVNWEPAPGWFRQPIGRFTRRSNIGSGK